MAIHIYLETAPESELFNYRGEAAGNDDPAGFKRVMARSGLRVLFRAETIAGEAAGMISARELAAVAAGTSKYTSEEVAAKLAGRDIPLEAVEA